MPSFESGHFVTRQYNSFQCSARHPDADSKEAHSPGFHSTTLSQLSHNSAQLDLPTSLLLRQDSSAKVGQGDEHAISQKLSKKI